MNRLAMAAFVLLAADVSAQSVATLSVVEGPITINQGEQFIAARPSQSVKAGDRIMAADGSSATVTYADGCNLQIAAGTLVTLPATSPCAGGVPLVQGTMPAGGAVVGSTAATGSTGATVAWIAGGVLVGVGVHELIEDDDDTSSP